MFEQFRYKVGLTYTRFHFRSGEPDAVRWTGAFSNARRALLLLPEIVTDSASLQYTLDFFAKQFTPSNLLIVGSVDAASRLKFERRAQVVTYAPVDMNAWFLPRSELTQKMKKSTFDVAIDLNLDLALPCAYLCRESNASMRVGFQKIHADTFYNFLIQPQAAGNFAAASRSLTECLRMF
ncbi:MAG: hypothetical protein L0Y80_12830 [Ignavibacteriae bacterium]|nr:hypothetical protein [Ignavibacteriota bacterium]